MTPENITKIMKDFKDNHWVDMSVAVTAAAAISGEAKLRVYINEDGSLDWEVIG